MEFIEAETIYWPNYWTEEHNEISNFNVMSDWPILVELISRSEWIYEL
jgi:hypothetical protein